ncbi:MAG: 3-keto-5-aminohexanoate cleavage protein [Myxococcota bacterium]|nr:3-keto-5-aminohexanoate cleavage protein [Myxococcota bacterium]
MNQEVVITCAITGSADALSLHPDLPVTPEQIADSAIEAARAGASVVHIHVRDPKTGAGSRDPALFREVVERIRSSESDVVLNLTAGMGGDFYVGEKNPAEPGPGTDFVDPIERLAHVDELLPEICTLDCGSMNFGDDLYVMMNPPPHLRAQAAHVKALGVKPELEIFDTGHFAFAQKMVREGLMDERPMYQFCHDIAWGMPADVGLLKNMVDQLPPDTFWTSFAISRMQMPWVAQSVLLGGHVRVGLEDNLYLEKGVLASNAQLVDRAVSIVENLGARVVGPDRARELIGLGAPGGPPAAGDR